MQQLIMKNIFKNNQIKINRTLIANQLAQSGGVRQRTAYGWSTSKVVESFKDV